ncbi:UNKNOWN [Stylonychia lemnae]|uniref:Uncharacterized protein n=1 Tax=Stylonychia lemnae TaxID=5949 RepID=A0A077ZP38_STYLE|nr:UNKNOWN [Stylonychia lemnae]|eukprot:CDW71224.1 UNKNOWN [Stylonychia lemnae]
MESLNKARRQSTLKKRLLYNRQRTYSDGDVEKILSMDPSEMTEKEKIIWKVEILKNSEDMDDLIDQKIRMIQEERFKINECMTGATDTISTYQKAVDRIAAKSRREPLVEQSRYESLINMARDDRQKKKTLPLIESFDVDQKAVRLRPNLANFNKLSNISNLAVNNQSQSARSHSNQRVKPLINQNQTLEIPEVFNRLYKQEQLRHCCDACKSGPCEHNKPDKSLSSHSQRSGSKRSMRSGASRGNSKSRPLSKARKSSGISN